MLNVSTVPMKASFKAGDEIGFLGSLNYAAWIARGEIRISKAGDTSQDGLVAVLPISDMATAEWVMPADGPKDLQYVFRVYDDKGRFDETEPLPLSRTSSDLPVHDFGEQATAPAIPRTAQPSATSTSTAALLPSMAATCRPDTM